MYVNLIILYTQFNFGLVPQTFGLVTSSNSLPEGQPRLFIFVSPWERLKRHLFCGVWRKKKKKSNELVSKTVQSNNSPNLNVHASASFPSTTGEKHIKLSCALTTAVETGAKKTESRLFSLLTGEPSRQNAAN